MKTRAVGYTRDLGKGRVTYFALGHTSGPHPRPAGPRVSHLARFVGERCVHRIASELHRLGWERLSGDGNSETFGNAARGLLSLLCDRLVGELHSL